MSEVPCNCVTRFTSLEESSSLPVPMLMFSDWTVAPYEVSSSIGIAEAFRSSPSEVMAKLFIRPEAVWPA